MLLFKKKKTRTKTWLLSIIFMTFIKSTLSSIPGRTAGTLKKVCGIRHSIAEHSCTDFYKTSGFNNINGGSPGRR